MEDQYDFIAIGDTVTDAFIRLTDASVLSLLPGWGPAGKSLLFTSYLQNNPDLYRLRLADSSLELVSNSR